MINIRNREIIILSIFFLICAGCTDGDTNADSRSLFSQLSPDRTGIDFENVLTSDRDFNIYTYRNFYNGGGVAIGDVNGDSLPDIYFSANMGANKLYLNRGDFIFEDRTNAAGVAGNKAWSTGVTMADVNSDGHLDIYVCNSGDVNGDNKSNELFINDGNGVFTEKAAEFGIDDKGYSTHAVFFDYDRDGDLDLYLLNNSYQAVGSFNLRDNKRNERDEKGGDKLFKNESGLFIDVSEQAGIFGSVIGFGLGITVGDVNGDHWPDIYVSNDFFERDYLYINNTDGTFSEELKGYMASISAASMGADMADIDNNGTPDIFVTEMLPATDERLKTKTTFDDWDRYMYTVNNGYYHQYNRNMLQLGNRDHTFTEVGRQAGVHATDWSWGALISDFDNDGWKDLFIANGIYQDLTDQDFLNYIADGDVMKSMVQDSVVNYAKLIEAIPSNRISNYLFKNMKNGEFKNVASEWGLSTPSHSNGSAYGDLDNDGDLDLVVNNVNMPPFIYRNNTKNQNWIQIVLKGTGKNTKAINTKIEITGSSGLCQYFEFIPQKGFQSSMDYVTSVGLGSDTVTKMKIKWPDGSLTEIFDPEVNTRHYIDQIDAKRDTLTRDLQDTISPALVVSQDINLPYKHKENNYVDFDRERLLYHMQSTTGPAIQIGDLNGDGREDIVIGGAANYPTEVFLNAGKQFRKKESPVFEMDRAAEVQDLLIHDFDGDGDNDLLSIHGGIEFTRESSSIVDVLYENIGDGSFIRGDVRLPSMGLRSNATGTMGDYDGDGVIDVFVAEGLKPYLYGVPGDGYLMKKTKEGKYVQYSEKSQRSLKALGLTTTSTSADLNGDGLSDLIVAGHYSPVRIYYGSRADGLTMIDSTKLPSGIFGWWNTVMTSDLDNDGDLDIILGNHGTNSRFKTSNLGPVCMHVNDFDQNGSVEQIVCVHNGEASLPLALRHDLVKQIPSLKKKYLKYDTYAGQTIEDIFSEEQREKMLTLKADEMRSIVLINDGGTFRKIPLPREAQWSPIYAIEIIDINQDSLPDLLVGGNLYNVKPEVGRYDATDGQVFLGNGDGTFTFLDDAQSGFIAPGEIRAIRRIDISGVSSILVARNNDTPIIFQFN